LPGRREAAQRFDTRTVKRRLGTREICLAAIRLGHSAASMAQSGLRRFLAKSQGCLTTAVEVFLFSCLSCTRKVAVASPALQRRLEVTGWK
jgi:hypothetical protein